MEPFLYKFFHEKTNDKSEGGIVNIPKDRNLWPENWKNVEYKTYPRLTQLPLTTTEVESELGTLLQKRNSDVSKICRQSVTEVDLEHLLKSAYGLLTPDASRRSVPSGGGLFPLEVYICLWKSAGTIPAGSYHYAVKEHALEVLPVAVLTEKDIPAFTSSPWAGEAHGMILLSAVFNRSIRKYGSRGYRYILLEAGHVGQNISLAAAELGLSVRPLGAIVEKYLEEHLVLNAAKEQIVYAISF